MANLRTTVILKTDIVDSTPRIAGQTQSEMGLERKQHKQFISDIAIKHLGSIFQEEGDAYWIEFPSVTTAVLAAIDAAVVENFLLEYDDLMSDVCTNHGGVIRQINGDLYFMTFEGANQTISAIKMLCLNWKRIVDRYNIGMSIGVHKGHLNVFRSYVFGDDINTTMYLSELGRFYKSDRDQIFVVISGKVKDEIDITDNDIKFRELDRKKLTQEIYQTVVREHLAYRLVVK